MLKKEYSPLFHKVIKMQKTAVIAFVALIVYTLIYNKREVEYEI